MQALPRVSLHCGTPCCACNNAKAKNPTHVWLVARREYMNAFMSTEQARDRVGGAERMKGREYRVLRKNQQFFLHRVADTRTKPWQGERAVYDWKHFRVRQTMTLLAGSTTMTVPVRVVGTVPRVRETYVTDAGEVVAREVVAEEETVVIECLAAPADIETVELEFRGKRTVSRQG